MRPGIHWKHARVAGPPAGLRYAISEDMHGKPPECNRKTYDARKLTDVEVLDALRIAMTPSSCPLDERLRREVGAR